MAPEILTVLDTAELNLTIPWTYMRLTRDVGWDPAEDWCCGDVDTVGHEWDCWRGPVWGAEGDDNVTSHR